ncbi:MAG: MFS transporter, partial [Proteobacteria bacterium]|nr:MFS transporter [Pseudomonadota bacterium]
MATLGFWAIKEKKVKSGYKDLGFSMVLKSLPRRLRANKNLRNYIYMLNFSGFGLTLLPFYVVLAKENYGLTGKQVGTYLLLHIIGMILSN